MGRGSIGAAIVVIANRAAAVSAVVAHLDVPGGDWVQTIEAIANCEACQYRVVRRHVSGVVDAYQLDISLDKLWPCRWNLYTLSAIWCLRIHLSLPCITRCRDKCL